MQMVRLGRFERPTLRLGGECSIQLSYNRIDSILAYRASIFKFFI